jgi:hypothetical protein
LCNNAIPIDYISGREIIGVGCGYNQIIITYILGNMSAHRRAKTNSGQGDAIGSGKIR